MGKNKLKKWNDILSFGNVYQQPGDLKNNWNKNIFHNNHPIVLELGCGNGEYTVALSALYPEQNIIGVDIKGHRLWAGAKTCWQEQRTNAAYIRCQIDHITEYFGANEVDEIWITFPDPQPQSPRERKRLTHPNFLERYKSILKKGGVVHLKTDSTSMYEYTCEVVDQLKLPVICKTDHLYNSELYEGVLQVKTRYEKMFTAKGENIKYIKFQLT